MKVLNFVFVSAAFALVFGVTSCQKDAELELTHNNNQPQFSLNCPGGGEDEDPLIMGVVLNPDSFALENVQVEIWSAKTSSKVADASSDSNGELCFNVKAEDYYFIFEYQGYGPDTSSVINISGDTIITKVLHI